MKRIGIVTLYKDNYGSELQCYATKHYLESLGYHCDIINEKFRGKDKLFHKIGGWKDTLWKTIRYRGFWANRKEMKRASRVAHSSLSRASQKELDYFAYTVLQPSYVDHKVLYDDSFRSQYSFFICGSDQVWNGANRVSGLRFLEFANDAQKVALSPSFGMSEVKSYNISKFKKEISTFRFLSVREETGIEIVRKLIGKTVPRLPDPVAILTPKEWEDFSSTSTISTSNYLLMHFLDEVSDETIISVNDYAKKNNLKVICFAYPRDNYQNLNNWTFVDGGPQDYLSLIRNADYVCTDSFHTTYFSIIFQRTFTTFSRNYSHNNSQNTRIETLLKLYDAEDHYVDSSLKIDLKDNYETSYYSETLKKERTAIRGYLSEVLSNYETSDSQTIPTLKNAQNCVGCMACADICAQNAISICYSDFGFKLPIIDTDKCVHCGLCEKVCNSGIRRNTDVSSASIAFNKDKNLQMVSASGGIFSALAHRVLLVGGVVVGAELKFDKGVPVCNHVVIGEPNELNRVLKSKYVESNMTGVYRSVEQLLKAGKVVLFGGTSCQVNALYSYLELKQINEENLFTVDLICHGVPGIKFFSDYISFLEEKNKSDVASFSFRKKEKYIINYEEQIQFAEQIQFVEQIPMSKSTYYRLFMHCESYRDQCYHCDYARVDKPADITIGDYFEARDDYPELFAEPESELNKNYISALIIHNTKGQKLVANYGADLFTVPVDIRKIQLSHPQLCVPSNYSYFRLKACTVYNKGGMSKLSQVVSNDIKKRRFIDGCKSILRKGQ